MSDKKEPAHSDYATTTVHDDSHGASFMDLFKIDPGLILWTWITFIFLFLILRKYAWNPLKESVEKREKDIAESVENAARLKESLADLEGKQKKKLEEAEKQRQTIIHEAKDIAERSARSIEDKAKETAEKLITSAKKEIEIERQKILAQLKRETVEIIIEVSSNLIDKSLDTETNKKLVEKYVEAL
jgi:F-type H+-transporting ATPase subunit b